MHSLFPVTEKVKTQLAAIRHAALDMDGTIYLGSRLFPVTIPFLEQLPTLGIDYTFLTNNSSKSRDDYMRKLTAMKIPVTPEQMLTSTHAFIEYLQTERPEVRRLYVLGAPCFQNELGMSGYFSCEDEPDAVVVAFDTTLSYERLCRAAWWISQGKPFIATHPDFVCPTDQPTVLIDCGAICGALEAATGVKPIVVGKPHLGMLNPIFRKAGIKPEELVVVGDRLMTDIAMAKRAGAFSVLVLTGEATCEDAVKLPLEEQPDLIVPDIGVLGQLLAEVSTR